MNDRPTEDADTRAPGSDGMSMEARVTIFARLAVVGLFAYLSLTLIAPFAIIILWAAVLAVALNPAYQRLSRWLGQRRKLAAFVLTIACLVLIVGPLAGIAVSFVELSHTLLTRLSAGTSFVPVPPEAVKNWPVVGERVYEAWLLAASNIKAALIRFEPHLLQAGTSFLAKLARFGADLVGFVLSVLVAGFLFGSAERLSENFQTFADRIGGERGIGFVRLAAATIRNVARGVLGIALLQAILCALVLGLFGVPAPGAIAFAVLVACIVQIGPLLVILPVVIWAFWHFTFGTAIVLTLALLPLVIIDNVMKPILVAKGLSTPTLVILLGVVGGTISYGLIGLFLGPIVLSVFYDLLIVWVRADRPR